jgi:hypothetical protein
VFDSDVDVLRWGGRGEGCGEEKWQDQSHGCKGIR